MNHSARGFSLIEALVAALLIAIAIVGLAHLVALGAVQAAQAGQSTAALLLAQSKLDELRMLPWRFDSAGGRVSSAALATSPPGALVANRDGFAEMLDRFGDVVTTAGLTHFHRRWSVTPWRDDADTLVLQACVWPVVLARRGAAPAACVWTVRTRQP